MHSLTGILLCKDVLINLKYPNINFKINFKIKETN
jgi:hypothetical protein